MTLDVDTSLWLSWPVLALLGLLVGSFLNVVAHRQPIMMLRDWWRQIGEHVGDADEWRQVFGTPQPPAAPAMGRAIEQAFEQQAPLSLVRPASRCPQCGHAIRWYENIPVVSWLVLRGRCSACKTPISARYPLVEVATAVLFGLAAWRVGPHPAALAWCAVIAVLVALTLIDAATQYLPDDLTGLVLWGGLLASLAGLTIPLASAVIGAMAGYLVLWTLSRGYQLLKGHPGMGDGDLKLLAGLCAWLGWKAILPISLMASLVGLAWAVYRKVTGEVDGQTRFAFGPFLCGGGIVVMLWGVDAWYEALGISLG